MTKFQPGDIVFGKFEGLESEGVVVSADDMTGRFETAPQSYTVEVEDRFGEPHQVGGDDDSMWLVQRAGQ